MRNLFPAYLRILLLFFTTFALIEYFVDSGNQPAFLRYPIVLLIVAVIVFLYIAIEIVVAAGNNVEYQILTDEEKKRREQEILRQESKPSWITRLRENFTR